MKREQNKQFNKPQDEFESKLIDLTRVTRVTAGGKQLRFRAIMVIGDRKGKIGLGVSKGLDVTQAIEKATKAAKKSIIEVPITKEGTIDHEIEAKFGPSVILLKPQMKGKGLVAGGTVRTLCQLAGIQDISSKILSRTSNKLNNAKATIRAFEILAKQS
jgi:small subunit ribosomal protein S5